MRVILGIMILAAGVYAALASWGPSATWTNVAVTTDDEQPVSRIGAISTIGDGSFSLTKSAAERTTPPDTAGSSFKTTVTHAAPVRTAAELAENDLPVAPTLSVSEGPADPLTQAALARDIQTELARLGCYSGAVDGSWSPATQRAASLFVTEANAVIPTAQPDFALLSLVRNAPAQSACGPAIAAVERPVPAMGLGGPATTEARKATRPAAYHNDRRVQSLFTNPLGAP